MAAKETRSRIIDAAIGIVRENAPTKLTLDEAARRAGVSKGGVLYHFTSKDDLIEAMIEHLVREQEAQISLLYEQEPEGPYRWLRTYVNYFFAVDGPGNDPARSACLAAVALNPALLKPVQNMMQVAMRRMMSDSPDKNLAALVSMGLDGLFMDQALGVRRYDEETLIRLHETILSALSKNEPRPTWGPDIE